MEPHIVDMYGINLPDENKEFDNLRPFGEIPIPLTEKKMKVIMYFKDGSRYEFNVTSEQYVELCRIEYL